MKKIFILTAVFALLSMSLNAQELKATKDGKVVYPKSQTEKVDKKVEEKVVTPPDGYFRMGPSRDSSTPVTTFPYNNGFDDSDQWNWWQVINANNDTKTWALYNNTARYSYHGSNAANDWLVTAPITLEAGKTYKFYINTWAESPTWPEKLEVKLASSNTDAALSAGTSVIGETTVNWTSTSPQTLSNLNVTVSTTGDYYFGIHAISDANQYYLYVDNLVIDVWPTDPVIDVSENTIDLSTIPGASATKTLTVSGLNLTSGINTLISGTDASLFSVSPASLGTSGGDLTITYSPTALGTHTATLTLSSTGADPVTITLNGTCTPDLTICDGSATSDHLPVYGYWYDASSGQKNQMIYPASLLAAIAGKNITSMTFYAPSGIGFSGGSVTFSLGTTSTNEFSDATALTDNVTAVATVTPNGETEWTITLSDPYTYSGGNLLIQVNTTKGSYGSTDFTGMEMGSSLGYWSYTASSTSQNTQTVLPKVTFAVEDNTPRHDLAITLSEPTAVVAGETATITATVTNNGNQTETGYTVTFSDGTTTFSTQTGGTLSPRQTETFTVQYPTTAAQGGTTVTITANVAHNETDATPSDNSATTNLTVNAQVHDLGITLSAPTQVVGGNTATVTATVTNNGDYTESSYTVTIYADGTAISTPTAVSLAPGESATFTADYATTNAQVGNTVNFTATVACTGDADATNNSATASTEVITLPPPEHVVATPDNNTMSATVTWDAPSNLPTETTTVTEYVTEDFEDTSVFPTFTTGGVNANSNTGAFGDWTLYDGNGVNVYGMSDVDFGSEVEQTPYAWMPFDLTATTPVWTVTNISAHSGQQFMNSVSVPSATTNHWLISPELSGNAQTISFYDAEMKTNWGAESYEVLYSTTDNNYSSFISLGTYSADALTWGYETANLPAGAKYFAIRHTTNDGFGLMIDDVRYEVTQTNTVTLAPESYNVYLDGVLVGNVDANDPLTYDFSNLSGGQHTVEISAVYPGNIESAKVPAQFTLTPKTATPTITYVVNGDNVVITATGNGTVNLTTSDGQSASGNGSASITVPRTDATFSVTATATAQESGKLESDPATETITIPFLQTAAPSISVSEPDANGNVVVTATGDGTVTLTTSDGQSVSGNGSVSITLPQQAHDYTVTAEAYAQESGKAASTTVTESVTVLGKIDDTWKEMTGTYTNDNDVLSFLTKVNGDTIDIMMVDQFKVSTLNNDHPDHYTYVMTETINGEDKYSNEVAIPVYKTNSSIQGLYTQGQVDTLDLKMGLRANVVNTKMDYDVNPDHNVLYYSLYRSDLDATYPEITMDSRISQLQKFDDNSTGTVQYYMFENHPTGVAPRYDHLGNEIAERLDTNWVECDFGQKLAYVPVIWTFGLYSGREDGKNNSYGSDIKREELGAVTVTVEGKHSDGSSMGKFTYDGVEYCIYHPVFNIEGAAPQTITQGDGDECTYVPYMYRAWCTYEGMRDYTADENGLKDNGPLAAPYLLGEEVTTNSQCHIGKNWTQGDGRLQNGFAIPTSVPDGDVTFIVRFYYKKEVAEAQSNGNKLRLGNGEGEEYFIAQAPADGDSMVTGISELMNGVTPVSVTYVNTQGMKSDKPFDGVNIVVTRYSDGSTVTRKVVR